MDSQKIRQTFLEYFEERDHRILPSAGVIPHDDPTLLFTNAGMNQFKDVFTGKARAVAPRAATVQKCLRAGGKHNDLDNVGYTARHLTFFEMLGNFSFGDYFKEQAIAFAWELLTEGFGLDAGRLWITVYRDDAEAREIWIDSVGVPPERVVGLGEKDNYWSMGDVGPCGPCSEIHLDRGEEYDDSGLPLGENESDRYFEIWNLVFMQYEQRPDGSKEPLARPCIDTGMGVERLAMLLQGVDTVFETDVLRAIVDRVAEVTGRPASRESDLTPYRVIADHVRSLVFALADGAEVSNEGRGYVLRRILRRAARYGRKLRRDDDRPLLCELVGTVLRKMGDAYPEIREREDYIRGVIENEETRFDRTLDQGIEQFESLAERLREDGETVVPGQEAFLLYDTFGFPIDLVEQMASEIGFTVDRDAYEKAMAAQRKRSRAGARFDATASDETASIDVESLPATQFLGHENDRGEAEILAAAEADGTWRIVLSHTPFYAESGGQVGDIGIIEGAGFRLVVEDTQKDRDRWIHLARLLEGEPRDVAAGAVVRAAIDSERRRAIERNHTATHLLHAALREVLGEHVHQKGSLVEAPRLRFDITHFSAISGEERQRVAELVEREIARNTPVETFETDHDDALRRGAMALFGEKYGDRVRVVRIGDFSMELCGGTHVERTGDIGPFALISEGSVSSGVRRVEALTERQATHFHLDNARLIEALSARLKAPPDQLLARLEKLQEENRKLRSAGAGKKAAGAAASTSAVRTEKLGAGEAELQCHSAVLESGGRQAALDLYDRLKARCKRGVYILLAPEGKKLAAVVAVTPALAKAGLDAREIFAAGKEAIDGRGGGRPEMVQGGGSRPSGAATAVELMREFVAGKV